MAKRAIARSLARGAFRAEPVNDAHRALNAAVREAKAHPGDLARRRALAREAAERFCEALERAYPEGFWETLDGLPSGDAHAIETAIAFLEEDSWFFRSGYVKGVLIRRLKRAALTAEQAARLRGVVLRAVDGRDRPRFREYCRLARKVDDGSLRVALEQRLASPDASVARRARWVRDACERG